MMEEGDHSSPQMFSCICFATNCWPWLSRSKQGSGDGEWYGEGRCDLEMSVAERVGEGRQEAVNSQGVWLAP